MVAVLRAHGAVDLSDPRGWTALHVCCKLNQLASARALLSTARQQPPTAAPGSGGGGEAAATIDRANADGDTPLHLCCRRGYAMLLALLLSHGADPDVPNLTGCTPLHCPPLLPPPPGGDSGDVPGGRAHCRLAAPRSKP